MKPTLITSIPLLVASCCPAPRIIHIDHRPPALASVQQSNPEPSSPEPSPSTSDPAARHAAAQKKATIDASIVSLRKDLDAIQAELKELAPYGGFCSVGISDLDTEFTFTEEQKKEFREKTGDDPDAFLQKQNDFRINYPKNRARWRELTKSEAELQVVLAAAEARSKQMSSAGTQTPP